MSLKTDSNTDKFFGSSSDELIIKEKMFISYELEKGESSNNYFIDDSGNLRYKIIKGKIFDFSL
jgi:hypothetical protein